MLQNEVREPAVFLQTRNTTCGIACMMMIMNYFLDSPLNSVFEGELRKKLKLNRFDLVPAINLARHMSQLGLDVTVCHQDSNKFWDYLRMLGNEDLLEQQELAFARARREQIIFNYEIIHPENIIRDLDSDRLLIFGIELGGDIKHALMVYEYDRERALFHLIDPLQGRTTYTLEKLLDSSDMNTGRWYISVGGKNQSS